MKKIALALGLTLAFFNAKSQLVVDNSVNANDAVQNILLGEGVEAFNITFSGEANQIGSFNSENSNIPLPNGVILATGDANVAVGPNDIGSATEGGGNFGAGDPDLQLLIPGFTLNDAAILEFDFVATGDSVSFRYVWSSEEYPEFVISSFNDVFGFFLSGPGINGPFSLNAINIALIPGTNLPVTIDNVNGNSNSQFYIDNNTNTDPTATQMDGFTMALSAEAGGLQCGETYHIKIALADAGDASFDSCVFLEGGSFSSSDTNITTTIPNAPPGFPSNALLEGCIDGFITIVRPDVNTNNQIQLSTSGTAVPNEHYEELPGIVTFPEGELTVEIPIVTIYDGTQEGTFTLMISYAYIDACGDEVEFEVELDILEYNPPVLDWPEELFLCEGENTELSAVPIDGFGPFHYSWSTGETSSTISINDATAGEINVEVVDFCQTVVNKSLIVLTVTPLSITGTSTPFALSENLYSCEFNEISTYLWTVSNGVVLSGQGSNQVTVLWGGEGLGSISVIETTSGDCVGDQSSLDVTIVCATTASEITGTLGPEELTQVSYTCNGAASSSYVWTISNGVIVSGQGTNTVDVIWAGTGFGTITVQETTQAQCTGDLISLNVVVIFLSVDELIHQQLSVYPNPASSFVTIASSFIGFDYALLNMSGQQVLIGRISNELTFVDISEISSGTYFLRIHGIPRSIQLLKH